MRKLGLEVRKLSMSCRMIGGSVMSAVGDIPYFMSCGRLGSEGFVAGTGQSRSRLVCVVGALEREGLFLTEISIIEKSLLF